MRSTAFREQHGKSIRSIVIDSTRESTISRRQATRKLFGIKQACVYNPSSQGRLRAFSLSHSVVCELRPLQQKAMIFNPLFSVFIMLYGVRSFRVGYQATRRLCVFAMATSPGAIKNVLVKDLASILKSDTRSLYQIIDVREGNELQIAALPDKDVIHLPLSQSNKWGSEISTGKMLDSEKPTICICHHGMRSMQMANFLSK